MKLSAQRGSSLRRGRPLSLFLAMAACSALVYPCRVFASTNYVSPIGAHVAPYASWADAARDIQSAVDVAADGDTVLVAAGVYTVASPVTVSNAVTVRGDAGSGSTVVSGNDATGCFLLSDPGAVVDGFTMTRGASDYGGGAQCRDGGTVRNCVISNNAAYFGGGVRIRTVGLVEGCIIVGNSATGGGGGVQLANGGTVSNCTLAANVTPAYGGGVYCYRGGQVLASRLTGNDAAYGGGLRTKEGGSAWQCVISSNTASLGGGGVQFVSDGYVSNSTVFANSAGDRGGGVFCYQGGEVCDSLVVSNQAANYGGGVACFERGHAVDCTISGNTAQYGGGFRGRSGGVASGCTIQGNTASLSGGGVQFATAGSATNCVVADNTAAIGGGGIYCYQGGDVRGCVIEANTARNYGGGVFFDGGGTCGDSTVRGNASSYGGGLRFRSGGVAFSTTIRSNSASLGGGGVQIANTGSLTNCLIVRNTSADDGGGVYGYQGGLLVNCTVSGNSAGDYGGGLYLSSGGTIRNTITVFNEAAFGGDAYEEGDGVTYASSCALRVPATSPLRSGDNIIGDPSFEDAGDDDYRLRDGSVCIDAGNDSGAPGRDITGIIRPYDGDSNGVAQVDIGAYEFTGTFVDNDGDLVDDTWELRYGFDPTDATDGALDSDGDGLTTLQEYQQRTHPLDNDTDGDGLTDGQEVNTVGSDPNLSDSDGDGFTDGYEVSVGSDPNSMASFPVSISGQIIGGDTQTGSIHVVVSLSSNYSEFLSTNLPQAGGAYSITNVPTPTNYWVMAYRDSSGNGTQDTWEAWGVYGSNPVFLVTNAIGVNVTLTDPVADTDGDTLTDYDEVYVYGTDPTKQDTDGDTLPDVWEVAHVPPLLPATADAAADPDTDGLSNLAEYQNTTDPGDGDSDDDGLSDGAEVNTHGTDPNVFDHDGDGYGDGYEVTWDSDPDDNTIFPAVISGTVLTGDTQTGTVWAVVSHTADYATFYRSNVVGLAAGPYAVSNVPTAKNYYIMAYRDTSGNRKRDSWEATGEYIWNPVLVGGDLPNVDMTLTDPMTDADVDGLRDYDEVYVYHTSPNNWDTDGDAMQDGWEVGFGLDPTNAADAHLDPDADLLSNVSEYQQGTSPTNWDTDADGMPDGWEVFAGTNVISPTDAADAPLDPDMDDLSNLLEYQNGTSPTNWDTDADSMPDGWEVGFGLIPTNAADGAIDEEPDGLVNADEYVYGTSPTNWDTDGDGMSDGWEVGFGLTPTNAVDAALDPDADDLLNLAEYQNGTSPTNADTDADGMPDGWEVGFALTPTNASDALLDPDLDALSNLAEYQNGTSPTNADTDADGMPDGWEIGFGLNPTNAADAAADPDADALANLAEYGNGTSPTNADTDFDTMPDGWEVGFGLNPTNAADASPDLEPDGLANAAEYVHGTSPTNADTDADGVQDGAEVLAGTDPTNPASFPASIGGTIVTVDSQTGMVYVVVGASSNYAPSVMQSVSPTGGAYTVSGLVTLSNYWVMAYREFSADGVRNTWEAWGRYPGNPIFLTNHVVDADVTVSDPTYDGDGDTLTDYQELYVYSTSHTNADTDADGMPDGWEVGFGLVPTNAADAGADPDTDDLTNVGEYQNGTSPTNADTDADSMPDGWEVGFGLVPTNAADAAADPDTDELANLGEYQNGTSPTNADTDADGMPDGWEVGFGLSPTNVIDAPLDPDVDMLSNVREYQNGTSPTNADTDADGMPDGWEVGFALMPTNVADAVLDPDSDDLPNLAEYQNGTSPTNADTDVDGMPDGWEVGFELIPTNVADAVLDPDVDLLANVAEYQNGTSPTNADTDADGMPDGWEVGYALIPTNAADAVFDPDLDDLLNLAEYQNGTSPTNADTDGDGMPDGWEVGYGLIPTNAADATLDADSDNLQNLAEYQNGTSATNADTDFDGAGDGFELSVGTVPTNAASFPASISGTVTTNDTQIGSIWVIVSRASNYVAFGSQQLAQAGGPYSITNLPTLTNYWIMAYRDSTGNGTQETWEAWGAYAGNSASLVANTSGVDIVLTDPLVDSDGDTLTDYDEWYLHHTSTTNSDTDGDGMPDPWEVSFAPVLMATNAADALLDPDLDGLTNINEYLSGTIPTNNDTDADGMWDGYEVQYYNPQTGLNPTNPADAVLDFEPDGLTNLFEFTYRTSPTNWDTDDDGLPDGWEVRYGYDPKDRGNAGDDDDLDSLSSLMEYNNGTSPTNADSDGDGANDGLELHVGTLPTNALSFPAEIAGTITTNDTQAGPIWVIVSQSSNYTAFGSQQVAQAGGAYSVTNLPNRASYWVMAYRDSTTNGAQDSWEAWGAHPGNPIYLTDDTNGVDLTTLDPVGDADGDGVSDYDEWYGVHTNATDPNDPDSDDDGLSDGSEIFTHGTNPNDTDTDVDGFSDSTEVYMTSDPLSVGDPIVVSAAAGAIQDGSFASPYDTIQTGVNAASPGAVVAIVDGSYGGLGNRDILISNKVVTVTSTNGYAGVMIRTGTQAAFLCKGAAMTTNTVIRGLTISTWLDYFGKEAISCDGASPLISECYVWDCGTAGILCKNGAAPVIRDTIVTGNGIGIRITGSSPSVERCTIVSNTAARGAGIYMEGASSPEIVNCLIADNESTTEGGGLYIGTGTSPTLICCTIAGNSAGVRGGGYYNAGDPNLFNSIIYGNTATNGAGFFTQSSMTIENCCLQQTFLPGANNTYDDPDFVGGGNYQLASAGSSAVDTGGNAWQPATDLLGAARPVDGDGVNGPRVDMGAYEFVPGGGGGGSGGGSAGSFGFGGEEPVSVLSVRSLCSPDAQCRVTWTSVSGRQYIVQSTTELGQPWQPLSGVITATNSTCSFPDTDQGSGTAMKFYRILVLP